MTDYQKTGFLGLKKALISFTTIAIVASGLFLEISFPQISEAELIFGDLPPISSLAVMQENSVLPAFPPSGPEDKPLELEMVITAYSSTVWETDETPFITASGTQVRDGVVANNILPFGTKIRIPELYGNKVFVVEDRMNWIKGRYQLDIWFPGYEEALNFGAKRAYVEILEN